ncbi:MAG TPA: DUF4411 family protein [Pyrinomonadaceae bacterium]|nr:DUF4411 family protein [Pyrinomonadaceae bacterium]
MTVYWLDADACIHAKDERHGAFPFSRMQKFWNYLSHQVDLGVVKAPKMVYDEITKGNDALAEWFRDREDRGLCENPNDAVWNCVTQVNNLVVQKYGDRKARRFLTGADPFVLAHAMAMGDEGIVVSHESTREQNAIVKIPTVCAALNIQQVSIFTMLNQLHAHF